MSINWTTLAFMIGLGVLGRFALPPAAIAGEEPTPPIFPPPFAAPHVTGGASTGPPPNSGLAIPQALQPPRPGDSGIFANNDHSSIRGIPLNSLPPDFWSWSTAEQTKWLQKRLSVVTLLEKVREKEDKIAPAKKFDQIRDDKTPIAPLVVVGPSSNIVADQSIADLPEVERVYERNGKRTADLRIGSLPARPFVVGSKLPNGLIVSEIGKDDVEVVLAPHKMTLPTADKNGSGARPSPSDESGAAADEITLPTAPAQPAAHGGSLSATAAALATLPGAGRAQAPNLGPTPR
jgi:hypothetical protein